MNIFEYILPFKERHSLIHDIYNKHVRMYVYFFLVCIYYKHQEIIILTIMTQIKGSALH